MRAPEPARALAEECPVRNAVVPVAGLGTRLLPATKSQPKEMLPVARKPIVQYVVEELARNGIRNVLFVTGRGKTAIENHFDGDRGLTASLAEAGRQELLAELDFEKLGINLLYTRQSVPRGLGDAILHGEAFTGREPFVVALGDSIIGIRGDSMVCRRMAEAFVEHDADVVIAVSEVPAHRVSRYGIVEPAGAAGSEVFPIRTLVEKPAPANAPSRLAVSGRYVFSAAIHGMIRGLGPDRRGEVQITDAIRRIAAGGGRVLGLRLRSEERRYDIGNMASYFETFIDFALADPDFGGRVRDYLTKAVGASREPLAGS